MSLGKCTDMPEVFLCLTTQNINVDEDTEHFFLLLAHLDTPACALKGDKFAHICMGESFQDYS